MPPPAVAAITVLCMTYRTANLYYSSLFLFCFSSCSFFSLLRAFFFFNGTKLLYFFFLGVRVCVCVLFDRSRSLRALDLLKFFFLFSL
jgi:hypothetical protein